MTAITTRQARFDPAALRELGLEAIDGILAPMDDSGDCDLCHCRLGGVPLTVSVTRFTGGSFVVAPRHAACGPAAWAEDPGVLRIPAQTHHYVKAEMAGSPTLSGSDNGPIPVIFITPSVDVQLGRVAASGKWVHHLADDAIAYGVTSFDPATASHVPRTWGAQFLEQDTLQLLGPASTYACQVPELVRAVRRHGGVQVVLAPTIDVGITPDVGLGPVWEAARRGETWSAIASLGAQPSRRPVGPRGAVTATTDAPGGTVIQDTDTLRALLEDVSCHARALFSNDAVLRNAGGPRGERLAVLLLEPGTSVLIPTHDGHRDDARVEHQIGLGMDRWSGGRPPRNPARDWRVRCSGDRVQLLGPFDVLLADAEVPEFPQGWTQTAAGAGAVLVIYGPLLGVRVDDNNDCDDDAARTRELLQTRTAGLASWGRVRWA